MNFIQEVLNLLERKQDKKKLDINRDYFEFGRTKPSSIGNPLYNPKMTPHAIKYKDFKCETIKGLISGTGTEHTLPVWSELDLTNCDVQTLIDSVYSQDAGATLGTVSANLLVKGDTTIEGDLLVLGKSTTIESTIVQIADNIIELNTLGADVNVGFTAGTTGGDKLFGWDSVNKYWSTFKEDFNTNTIIIDANIKFDNETIDNVVNQAEGLASNDNDNSLATVAAIKQYVDSTSGANTTYDLTGEVSNTNEFAIGLSGNDGTLDKVNLIPGTNITLTDNGSNGVIIDAAGGGGGITGNGITNYMTMWTGSTSIGNAPMKMVQAVVSGVNILTLGVDTDTDRVTFEATAEFQGGVRDRNGLLGTAGQVLKSNVSGDVSWADLAASPVMTSTVTGTGKLWDDTVQAVPTVSVSTVADRTYGVQFNDAEQLVVNVPWVEGSGGTGTVTAVDFTSDIAAFTAATVDGTTTPSISLDLIGGTVGQFLRQDGLWATIPGGNPGTVTDVSVLVNGGVTDAISLRVFDSTTTPRIELDFDGVADQYINGLGVLTTFPTINPGTVTSFSASLVNGDSLSVAVADSTSTPAANFTWGGTASEYVNGEGDLQPFPAIPAVPFTSLTTTGTTGAATLTSGVLNIPEYTSAGTENCTFGYDVLGDGKALTSTFVPIQSAGNVVLGYENTSGVRTNYLNTISLTFETKSSTKTYDFEIRFEARVSGVGVVPLQTYEDSFYSEGDKVITKTYTYYSPNLESNGEIFVSARTLGLGDLAIKTSHIAVVSSSCDAITEGKVRDVLS
jgi:hypothetical protein|tara:strand:+ start:3244 stop:5613 length:2370 start_codon:yes stop_codon:yes gene_type:complete